MRCGKSAKMPLEEVPLQFPITILCERQLGQKNRVNEIYKEIQKMLPAEKEASTIKLGGSAKNLTEKDIFT